MEGRDERTLDSFENRFHPDGPAGRGAARERLRRRSHPGCCADRGRADGCACGRADHRARANRQRPTAEPTTGADYGANLAPTIEPTMAATAATEAMTTTMAVPADMGSIVFFSTQFVPVEEAAKFRAILKDGGFDFTGSEEGPLLDMVTAEAKAGKGTVDLVGALHGTFPPLQKVDAMSNMADVVADLSADRKFAPAYLSTGLLGTQDYPVLRALGTGHLHYDRGQEGAGIPACRRGRQRLDLGTARSVVQSDHGQNGRRPLRFPESRAVPPVPGGLRMALVHRWYGHPVPEHQQPRTC